MVKRVGEYRREGSPTVIHTIIWQKCVILCTRYEVRRCDWLEIFYNLETHTELMHRREIIGQSQRRISPCTSNHEISPDDSVIDKG